MEQRGTCQILPRKVRVALLEAAAIGVERH